MAPTETGTCIFRRTIAANSDGSLAIVQFPYVGNTSTSFNPIWNSTGAVGVVSWTSYQWDNVSQYASNVFTEARIIASALRITPLVAATVAPGIIYAGTISSTTSAAVAAQTPATFSSLTSLKAFVTMERVQVNMRPIDNSAYEFIPNNAGGTTSSFLPNTTNMIVLTGFPAGASILVESVLHFEYLPIYLNAQGRDTNILGPIKPDISSAFPSFERMWDYTTTRLNPSAVVDTAVSLANFMTARTIRNAVNGVNQRRLME